MREPSRKSPPLVLAGAELAMFSDKREKGKEKDRAQEKAKQVLS